jgi:transposase
MKDYSINEFLEHFGTDDQCLDFMFEREYGGLRVCPKCGVVDPSYYRVKGRKCYECKDCGNQLHPLAHTIFHKSSTSLRDWFYVVYLFSVSKNGVSAMEVQRHLGVTYKCAWRLCKQVRRLMQENRAPLEGIVQADETYVGGTRKKWQQQSQWTNKTAVIGIVEKKKGSGKVKAFTAKGANATNTIPFLQANVKPGSTIHTDESKIYHRVKRDFDHQFVNHSKYEYVRAGVSTNVIEGFWGQLKRSIDGTYHCVSPKYLPLYLSEFTYRYNHRDHAAFPVLISAAIMRY